MGRRSGQQLRTCDVSSSKGDSKLLCLAALCFGLGHDVSIESVHYVLECSKLHHCVGNLTTPERHQRLEETAKYLCLVCSTPDNSWRCPPDAPRLHPHSVGLQSRKNQSKQDAIPANTFLSNHLGHAIGQSLGKAWHSLHLDLHKPPGACHESVAKRKDA